MTNRGQSTLDFLLGAVIFLLAVVIVVAAIPGMLDPFASGTESHPVVADRAVTTLATDTLTEHPDSPYLVSQNGMDAVFGKSESELIETLGMSERVHLNVTLTNRTGTINMTGPAPPPSSSVTSAWRVVEYAGEPANVTVRVW